MMPIYVLCQSDTTKRIIMTQNMRDKFTRKTVNN